jgi:GDPmannose 4,6-dehydratase
MPSAFLTGATGQDGSYLIEQLGLDGWDVHALVRKTPVTEEQPVPDWVTTHVGDLLDADAVSGIISEVEPDTIFNLAGITSVAQSWDYPELTGRVTGLAVGTLLDAAWKLQERLARPVRFVQATSSEIFGSPENSPQNEDTPIRPVSPYGAAKAYAHHLVSVYRARGLFASAAILYNHESPRRPSTFVTRKITAEIARISTGRSTKLILGNTAAERDWGWAPDYVSAMVLLAQAEHPFDAVISTGELHSVRDFVAAAFAEAGISDWEQFVEIDQNLFRPVDATRVVGDSSRARDELGWQPTVQFPEIVARMVRHDLELLTA